MFSSRRGAAWTAVVVAVVVVAAGAVVAQSRRGVVYQNDPPPTEFKIARWVFNSNGYDFGWEHDYPNAEQHILQLVSELTSIDVDRFSYRIVDLASDEVFDYPFSYVSHPGSMGLNAIETENLREYIARGGFVMMDDFGGQGQGPREFEYVRSTLKAAFPDREMFELPVTHPIFHNFYDINAVNTVHPMSGQKSVFLGYPDDRGGTAMIVCYHNDVGDYWEFLDNPRYALEPSTEAVRLGLNFVLYALTH
jgi:hypothetical protein